MSTAIGIIYNDATEHPAHGRDLHEVVNIKSLLVLHLRW
jgi:hypothetical protein